MLLVKVRTFGGEGGEGGSAAHAFRDLHEMLDRLRADEHVEAAAEDLDVETLALPRPADPFNLVDPSGGVPTDASSRNSC